MPKNIEVQGVSFSYTGDSADVSLRRINLTVQRGEAVLLCGPSCFGKTTLTRLINGLVPTIMKAHFWSVF
jgi:energy-coupling factor transporter ATP-binding protein EcfA2